MMQTIGVDAPEPIEGMAPMGSSVRPILTSPADGDPNRSEDPSSTGIGQLIERAKQGDSASLGELLQTYRNYLSVLALSQIDRRLRTRMSPSDAVQETMLKAHRAFASFRGKTERELAAWLRRILANNLAAIVEQHMTTAKRDVRREVSLEKLGASIDQSAVMLEGFVSAGCSTPSVSVQRREEAVLLADRIAQLPLDYREVLTLRNLQGLAFSEVAAAMNRSEPAARVLWLRAIQKLRGLYPKDASR